MRAYASRLVHDGEVIVLVKDADVERRLRFALPCPKGRRGSPLHRDAVATHVDGLVDPAPDSIHQDRALANLLFRGRRGRIPFVDGLGSRI